MAGVANIAWEPHNSMHVHLAEDTVHILSTQIEIVIHVDETSKAEIMEIKESQRKMATALQAAGLLTLVSSEITSSSMRH